MLDQGITFNVFNEVKKVKTADDERNLKLLYPLLISWDASSSEEVKVREISSKLLKGSPQPYAVFAFKKPVNIPVFTGKLTAGVAKKGKEKEKELPPDKEYEIKEAAISAYQVRNIDESWIELVLVEQAVVAGSYIENQWILTSDIEVIYQ